MLRPEFKSDEREMEYEREFMHRGRRHHGGDGEEDDDGNFMRMQQEREAQRNPLDRLPRSEFELRRFKPQWI